MSENILLRTKNNQRIVIELLDNDFVKDYLDQLKKVLRSFAFTQHFEEPRVSGTVWNQAQINTYQDGIKNVIRQLNDMNLNFPIDIHEVVLSPDNHGRVLLNTLHRYFTTGCRSVTHGENRHIWQDNTDLEFSLLASDCKKFSGLIHEINDIVHKAEKYYVSDREIKFGARYREYHILFDPSRPLAGAEIDATQYFVSFEPSHYEFFSDNLDYDVWLPSGQILGKNWWRAYFDLDEPTHWDISLNINYSGSLSLGQRVQAHDPELVSWLKSYGINPGPLHTGMPLGNIIFGQEFVADLGIKDSIVDIIVL